MKENRTGKRRSEEMYSQDKNNSSVPKSSSPCTHSY